MNFSFKRPAVLALIGLLGTSALAQERVKVGTLNCDISAGLGLIIGSRKEVRCAFDPSGSGRQEYYVGSITKFGLDIGVTAGGHMIWAVWAPSGRGYGALEGNYVGASGEVSVVAGLGANVLVGGSNRTVALQPVSVQVEIGLNLALGVAELELRAAR